VAFSDYRVHDIELIIEEFSRLQPPPDLILYAGDDIRRFRPFEGKNLFEAIAACARYGLCAIAGNDDQPSVRELICGKSVINVHLSPAVIGDYAVLGIDGAPYRNDLKGIGDILHSEREIERHLNAQAGKVKGKNLLILSHAPPEGILDEALRFSSDGRPRSIGSRALKKFLRRSRNVRLTVCGHVHRCGGMHKKFHSTLIVNAANHDDCKEVARFAVLDLDTSGSPQIEWRQIRETSVVAGIGEPSAGRLREVGIRTVEELAAAPLELIRRVPHLGENPAVLRARAQARVQERPILFRAPSLPSGRRLFLDIETDLRQEYVWLVGFCTDKGGRYKAFFAERPTDEKRILVEFLDFMKNFPAAPILTCSNNRFEQRVLRDRFVANGLDDSICKRIVDLYSPITRSVALPAGSCRVKDMGASLGYQYKHPDLDGFDVASLYQNTYLFLKNETKRHELKRKLIEYNEDDVRCLPYILDAITGLTLEEN
jgi:Icc-related predicted phosphoesterase/uncharacterized protein YprB with RNaseH-like and TPR domain